MAMQLRPLSVGELLDRTFSLYRNNFVLFVGIMVVPELFSFAGTLAMAAIPKLAAGGAEASSAAVAGMMAALLGFFGLQIVHFIAYGIAQGATVYAVSQVYMERSTTIADSYHFMSKRIWPVLAVILLSAVAMMVGLIVFLVGAIFAFLFFSLAVPVCVLEGRDAIAAMQRSYALVKGDLAKIFLVCLVFYLIQIAAVSMVTYPAMFIGLMYGAGGPPYFFSILSALAQFAATSLATPLITIGVSLAYYDYRVRQEALDLQMMMASLGPVSPSGIQPGAASSASGATN